MLAGEKLKQFTDFIGTANREEMVWMNGYLSAIINTALEKPAVEAPKKITIAYGTETGNSKKLATSFAARAKKTGIRTKLVGLDQYTPAELANEDYFFTIISTHGEGEPPAAAKNFYDHIHKNGFQIPQMKYGVLALGDTAYPLFCKTGEDVDKQLQQLGARRIAPLQKCDVDYEAAAENWFGEVLQKIAIPGIAAPTAVIPATEKKPAGKTIYAGIVLSNINITGRGSSKKTHHIEIATDAVYLPGDSIAVLFHQMMLYWCRKYYHLQASHQLTKASPGATKYGNGTGTALLNKANIVYLAGKNSSTVCRTGAGKHTCRDGMT